MKKIISCIIFLLITLLLIIKVNDILVFKATNRYYILEKELENIDEKFDVHVYGSCHAYTTFNPVYLKQNYKLSSYVFANPGEIIPTTYLRMLEQLKKDTPDVALVEIWGINAYDTYDTYANIFGYYLPTNLERTPFSKEKLEVIKDFNLDVVEMSFPIYKYKNRIMTNSLTELDFDYYFEGTKPYATDYVFEEMTSRINNYGFKSNNSEPIDNYLETRKKLHEDDYLKIEGVLVKYIEKIIELCKEKNIKLIFYRSPYNANENELKKLKHFKDICKSHNVDFIDLEEEIEYDFDVDFKDTNHLSEVGANKSTDFLANYILNSK